MPGLLSRGGGAVCSTERAKLRHQSSSVEATPARKPPSSRMPSVDATPARTPPPSRMPSVEATPARSYTQQRLCSPANTGGCAQATWVYAPSARPMGQL